MIAFIVGAISGYIASCISFVYGLVFVQVEIQNEYIEKFYARLVSNRYKELYCFKTVVSYDDGIPQSSDTIIWMGGFVRVIVSQSELKAGWKPFQKNIRLVCFRWDIKRLQDLCQTMVVPDRVRQVFISTPYALKVFGQVNRVPNNFLEPCLDQELDIISRSIETKSKIGLLLTGNPGTGKSTFVKYLCEKYDLNLILMSLEDKYTNQEVINMFGIISQYEGKKLVLFEDFDNLFSLRKPTQERTWSFDTLINCIDGCYISYGQCVFVMTTNDKEKIDHSLTRKGRFGIHVDFNNVYKHNVSELSY